MTGPGKGDRRRESRVPDDAVAQTYITAYGTEYCFHCQHIRNVRKITYGDRMETECEVCGTTISVINILKGL